MRSKRVLDRLFGVLIGNVSMVPGKWYDDARKGCSKGQPAMEVAEWSILLYASTPSFCQRPVILSEAKNLRY